MVLDKLTGNLREKVAGATGFLNDLKDERKEKLLKHINGLGDILPIVAQTGYHLIVNSLVTADEFHQKVKLGNHLFTDIPST